MFPVLYKINPWVGVVGGGLIWYGWHLPLALVVPQPAEYPLWQTLSDFIILAVGSICTFTYLAYAYIKSRSIWVTSIRYPRSIQLEQPPDLESAQGGRAQPANASPLVWGTSMKPRRKWQE